MARVYTAEQKARKLAYHKAWREANPDRVKANHDAWYESVKANRIPVQRVTPTAEQKRLRRLESAKRWAARNPDKIKAIRERGKTKKVAKTKLWRKANPDKVLANKKRWNSIPENAAKNRARADRWASLNQERVRSAAVRTAKRWASRNPEKVAVYKSRSHANRKSKGLVAGTFTPEEWSALLDRTGHVCVCCGISEAESIYRYPRQGFPLRGKLTIDHIVPLSKGGSGSIENIAPLCLPCNMRKHVKDTNYILAVAS